MRKFIRKLALYFYWKYRNYKEGLMIYNYDLSPKIKLGKKVMIRKNTEISNVIIGDFSYISGPNTFVKDAIIGKHCSIARNVIIGVEGHEYHWLTTGAILVSKKYGFIKKGKHAEQKQGPIIGNDVWIGLNCIIMRGVTVGDGAVIAAGAVVTKNVEPYSIVAGVPARHIKYRFSLEDINALLKIEWWNWPDEEIRKKVSSFYDINKFKSEIEKSK